MPKVHGLEDNGDLATVYGFTAVPHGRWTHGHVRNVAEAIVAAFHTRGRKAVFNAGEEATPSLGERLALLPRMPGEPPEPPPFDFDQSLVVDTSQIRWELGYVDVVDERSAMIASASRVAR